MKTVLTGVTAFLLGLGITVMGSQSSPRTFARKALGEAPPGRKTPPLRDSTHAGGLRGPLRAEIVPERTTLGPGGEVLDYSVRLHNQTDDPVRARHAVELVTDRGIEIVAPRIASISDLAVSGVQTDMGSTPSGLADGFYILRATAAAAAPSGDATTWARL